MWFVIESVCYYFVSWSNRKHVHPANSERKARYEECSLITLQLYYLFSFGKYTAKIHIVQFTIYSVFVTTYLGKQLLLSCTRCRVLQLFFFFKECGFSENQTSANKRQQDLTPAEKGHRQLFGYPPFKTAAGTSTAFLSHQQKVCLFLCQNPSVPFYQS